MSQPTPRSDPTHRLRPNAIGVFGIIFFVVAAVGPMGVVLGAAPLVFGANGAGAPATYVICATVFVVFAVGLVAMSRFVANAGGFATYIATAFGNRAGGAAAMVALLTYVGMLCGLYAAFAVFAESTFREQFSIDLPWQAWLFMAMGLIAVLGYKAIDVSMRVLGILLILEIGVLLVLDFAILFSGGDAGISFEGFSPTQVFGGTVGTAFLWAFLSFGGFEATVVYSEEAKDPRRTIPRATYSAVTLIGLFYALTTFSLSMGYDAGRGVQEAAAADPVGFIFALSSAYVGPFWTDLMHVLVVTSFFAIVLGFHNIAGRYVFALGRAGLLPSVVGRSHPKYEAPHIGSTVVTATVLLVLTPLVLAGTEPFTQIYSWLVSLGAIGLLSLTCTTSLAIAVFFRRTGLDNRMWNTRVAPLLAATAFAIALYLAVENWSALTGTTDGAVSLLPALVPVAAATGWGVASTRRMLDFERHPGGGQPVRAGRSGDERGVDLGSSLRSGDGETSS